MTNAFYHNHNILPLDVAELPPDLPFDFASPFVVGIHVSPDMIDLFGHANHTCYPGWWAAAAWAHSRRDGLTEEVTQSEHAGMAVTRSEIDYLSHVRAGDELVIAVWISQCDGKLRAQRRFQAIRLSDRQTMARAHYDLVCFDLVTGKPRRMPASFRHHYQPVDMNMAESPLLTPPRAQTT